MNIEEYLSQYFKGTKNPSLKAMDFFIDEFDHPDFVRQEDEVNQVIQDTCSRKNNNLHIVSEENIKNYSYDENYQKFDYKQYENILVNLKGYKQCINASIVIECIEILNKVGYKISEADIKNSLKTIVHKARFETINENPLIIYDGAHNEPAINNLKNTINMYHKNDKKLYIVSILKTKDYKSMLKRLCDDTEAIYIFTNGNDDDRYVDKSELLRIAKMYLKKPNLFEMNLKDSISIAKNEYKEYTIFIVGSFYIYGDVLKYIKH